MHGRVHLFESVCSSREEREELFLSGKAVDAAYREMLYLGAGGGGGGCLWRDGPVQMGLQKARLPLWQSLAEAGRGERARPSAHLPPDRIRSQAPVWRRKGRKGGEISFGLHEVAAAKRSCLPVSEEGEYWAGKGLEAGSQL